ncbi:hypothetical protein [Borrelia miyamotoi]|uniref:Uncharacterized protein n=1 Tax=Borrelia miyamotoi TaxID=47466 RepID=A0AAQ3AG74_9SPIR|nr:hypothetical protein [Borrelia miyamotoi]AGT27131.1 putative lipoprotein [Borrelia miyamotoi LB-2001]QTL83292.1 hypothetical protein bmLB2001_000126 [Borrelia miyamotoi]WAZ85424.1 hypothetical protein O5400_03680 [Borrelia miyamotoi]WAZ91206.1 hypothetical protein O5398_03685 [Borrelia miyamotoi]WAZ93783.1 hypothetical protein O5399_03685 [Borrelia miyamotoi]
MLKKIKARIVSLDDYLIVCGDFKGKIESFFDYIVRRRDLLKTFSLNKIIEDFLIFSDSLEMDVKELIIFYSFATSLLYLKTQIFYPVKLKNQKLVEREVVRKLISFSEKYEKSKAKSQNLKDGVYLSASKVPFFRKNSFFVESVDSLHSCVSEIKAFKCRVRRSSRVGKKNDDILCNTKRSNVILGTYDARILDKKTRVISVLAKEDNFIFEFLLDPDDKCYFFDRFCYFLVVLEYKMLDIIDIVYVDGKLVLKKGRSIDKYEQQRA